MLSYLERNTPISNSIFLILKTKSINKWFVSFYYQERRIKKKIRTMHMDTTFSLKTHSNIMLSGNLNYSYWKKNNNIKQYPPPHTQYTPYDVLFFRRLYVMGLNNPIINYWEGKKLKTCWVCCIWLLQKFDYSSNRLNSIKYQNLPSQANYRWSVDKEQTSVMNNLHNQYFNEFLLIVRYNMWV